METPQFSSLCHLFQDQVRRRARKPALLYKKTGVWQHYTWSDWSERALTVSRGLLSLGLKGGDRISMMSENRPEWVFVDYGILHIAAVNVAVYTSNTAQQIAYILKDCAAAAIFVSNETHAKKILEAAAQLPALKYLIYFDEPKKNIWDRKPAHLQILSFEELLERGRAYSDIDPQMIWPKLTPDDLATLIYTSGTTGDPKGVMLTHGNMVSDALACCAHMKVDADHEINFSFLPLCHAFERIAGYYYPMGAGIPIAYAESLERIVQNLGEVRPSRFCGVPRIFEKIHAKIVDNVERSGKFKKNLFHWALGLGTQVSQSKRLGKPIALHTLILYQIADQLVFRKVRSMMGGRIMALISGGGALNPAITAFFDAMGITVIQGYGLTETAPVVAVNLPDNMRYDTVGLPLPGIQVKIAEDGEILVKGPNVMKGYYNRPEDTKRVFTDDGWLLTGDIGVIDPDGHLRITDRKKDIIVTAGGKNVAPQNIENQLKLDPYIEQVCVIGDRRKYISSLIVPRFDSVRRYAQEKGLDFKTAEELVARKEIHALIQKSVDRVNAQLAPYESIRKFVLLPREFSEADGEITPTMKVRRKVVQTKYADLIERMYS